MALYNYILLAVLFLLLGFLIISVKRKLIKKGWLKGIFYVITSIAIVLTFHDDEMREVLDDCMSFPGLYVYVNRYKRCTVDYYDMNWNKCTMKLEGDLSELL